MKNLLLLLLIVGLSTTICSQGINVSIITTDESCIPGGDGTAMATVSGGMPPYTYVWSPGFGTTPMMTGLTAGTYALTVGDANGRNQTASATVNQAQGASVSAIILGPSCAGSSDGSITLTTTGGNPPFTYLWSNLSTTPSVTNLVAGTYTVTVVDAMGCTSTNTIIMADPLPMVTTVSQSGPLLSADQGGAIYKWLDCNNNYSVISGANSRNFTAPGNGDYAVEITFNSCTDTSNCVNVTLVGIEESQEVNSSIRVYPNPSQGELVINRTHSIGSEQLRLFDLNGKVVLQKMISRQQVKLDLSHLEKGLYFLELDGKQQKVVLTD